MIHEYSKKNPRNDTPTLHLWMHQGCVTIVISYVYSLSFNKELEKCPVLRIKNAKTGQNAVNALMARFKCSVLQKSGHFLDT